MRALARNVCWAKQRYRSELLEQSLRDFASDYRTRTSYQHVIFFVLVILSVWSAHVLKNVQEC